MGLGCRVAAFKSAIFGFKMLVEFFEFNGTSSFLELTLEIRRVGLRI